MVKIERDRDKDRRFSRRQHVQILISILKYLALPFMYLHSQTGTPLLIDSNTEKVVYSHHFSDLPIATEFDPADIFMIVGNKRVIDHLLRKEFPRNISLQHTYNEATKRLEELSQTKMRVPDGELVPYLGCNDWDPPIYITGATGSGKSTIATKIIMNDKKNRPVYLFTNHKSDDVSLKPIWKKTRKVVMHHPEARPLKQVRWGDMKLENSICLFDDIGSNKEYKELRDQLLEEGRHMGICVIVIDHEIKPNVKNKKCFEECRTVILFPHSNLPSITRLLERHYNVPAKVRRKVIEMSVQDGRYLIYHQAAPIYVSTAQTCRLLQPLLNK